ncbi:flavodoxin family protein [Aminithiophilus ramosus]|uniref:Flavodoxin family protein n=2 Tax=Synergistales TaxID=649776 RepID=A0A9Q7AKC0_9BACT|nr:flavodoxin family protein [Aminithiophilus ramosus]QTX33125.1 flavodoxin family protein [Aminithiophilus ramosus]QVL37113.1 flavodoxin family protein [Synergistota bacterium]
MTKVTLILGSPRRGGNTETLAEAFLSAPGKAERIDRFRLYDMSFQGCIDCRGCWTQGRPCLFDDDLTALYESLREADVVLFASPLYWYSWTGPVKTLWDRLLPLYGEHDGGFSLKGKRSVLIGAAGDEDGTCFQGLLFSFRRSSALMGMAVAGEFCLSGLYEAEAVRKRPELLQKMALAGKSIL